MKLNKEQLIECLTAVQNRNEHLRAGQAFWSKLTEVNRNLEISAQKSNNDTFNVDKNIINFVANFCDEEAMQYFYSTHSQDLFKL